MGVKKGSKAERKQGQNVMDSSLTRSTLRCIVIWPLKEPLKLAFIKPLYYFQVFYVNDGSEHMQDAVVFEIELTSANGELPPEMRLRQRFRLQISIRPVNDVPHIEVNKGQPLRIGKDTGAGQVGHQP